MSASKLYWPDLYSGNVNVSPPRNGMNRFTGGLLQAWSHVEQSLWMIFSTPFSTRVLRGWVGSFVPAILGRNLDEPTIARFYWAMTMAIDLWEPDYRITKVFFMNNIPDIFPPITDATSEEMVRAGQGAFAQYGIWYPRGHLGNYTPAGQQNSLYQLPSD